MNRQGKCANFSPYQEKSYANQNSENCCCEHAYDWGGGQHRRSPQQIKTIFECSGVLRVAAAGMPWQPRLSGHKEVKKSDAKKNSQSHCRKYAYARGSSQHRRGPQRIKTAVGRSDMLRITAAIMSRQPGLSGPKQIINPKGVV